ncbi:MAG: glucokinase [Betaproteobacteria bacterium]
MASKQPLFLVGDVGATNARLAITALRDGAIEWIHEARLANAELSNFDAAIHSQLVNSFVQFAK